MIITLASQKELAELCALENESFGKDDFRLSKQNFFYHIHKKHVIIIKEDKMIAGYLLFFVYQKSLRVYSLAVHKSFRNQQMAQHLLLHVKNVAHTLCKEFVTLEVRIDNNSAINLYHKMGFEEIALLKNYYCKGRDGLKMKCKIDGAVGGI